MGLGKTDEGGENGKVEILVYPLETNAVAIQK
jgi:hypothetical protein